MLSEKLLLRKCKALFSSIIAPLCVHQSICSPLLTTGFSMESSCKNWFCVWEWRTVQTWGFLGCSIPADSTLFNTTVRRYLEFWLSMQRLTSLFRKQDCDWYFLCEKKPDPLFLLVGCNLPCILGALSHVFSHTNLCTSFVCRMSFILFCFVGPLLNRLLEKLSPG